MKKYLLLSTVLLNLTVAHNSTNAQGTWTQKADFAGAGAGRWAPVGFSIGNKGYIGTGNYGADQNDFWEWSPVTNVWTQKANFAGAARRGAAGFSIGTKGYMGTGFNENLQVYYKDFWEYDPSSNTWTQKTDFGGAERDYGVGFAIGSKGYIGTGQKAPNTKYNDFWEYDPISDSWTQKANCGVVGRYDAGCFTIGTKGYIGAGVALMDFWEWDQATDIWTQKANCKQGSRGFSIGAKGYFLYDTLYEYNVITDVWVKKIDFPGASRTYCSSFSIGSLGYIGTGISLFSNPPYKDFWEYCDTCNGVGTIENEFKKSLFISPNPFFTQTILHADKLLKNALLTVYNSFGQTVRQIDNLSGQSITFQRENLPSGLYFIRLSENNQTIATDKLIIRD